MCTFSFVPNKYGYYAAMNRDERLTRETAAPPKLFRVGGLLAAYPHEPAGGTWIASNQRGITLALLNWNLPLENPRVEKQLSRGSIIPQLVGHSDLADVAWKINSLSLKGTLPFRLVGVFWPQEELCEFRWGGSKLQRFSLPWQRFHWFSSGVSDEAAQRARGEACRLAWKNPAAGSLPWLRALHASHMADGAFSMCVHRPDAATVSYSEVEYRRSMLTFRYSAGPPCHGLQPGLNLSVPLVSHQDTVVA